MNGASRIAFERQRQIEVEGYTAEHDHGHADELLRAGRCYAAAADNDLNGFGHARIAPPDWPWHPSFWKPTGDPVRDLEKAGALIAAAIDDLLASAAAEPIEVLRTSTGTSEEGGRARWCAIRSGPFESGIEVCVLGPGHATSHVWEPMPTEAPR